MSQDTNGQHVYEEKSTTSTPPSVSTEDTPEPKEPAATADENTAALPVPLGGTRAWLQVLGGFFAFINIWGFPLSYGVFQNFYAVDFLSNKSESDIAWIGTVQNFLVSMVSVLSGPIYDLGYYRTLVFSGCFLSTFGIFMLSLSHQYYSVFLSHICNGVGSGLLYVPTLALVAQGHGKTRSLAMGIVAGGIALGTRPYCFL